MGTTLAHGIYLPSEGERNCYAGLKLNWETLDQKVADISALQSAIAGALHREIVASLPTTDIDTATIYMILNGTSATENVYDEFMYVNNAWELIGTSATDLTNYYTKAEVDGKLLLKANASDLTSHTGDTTIHVTASDKAKWNTVALIKHLRLVNTQVGSATTIPFSDFDDTNGIKVGDKCMDLDGKMFEITAVDTANQTVTVGSALIDLALDANVMHLSGNETVAGIKSFSDYTNMRALNSTNEVPSPSSSSSSIMPIIVTVTYGDGSPSVQARLNLRITANGEKSFYPHENNQYSLGLTSRRFKEIYAYSYKVTSDINGINPGALSLPDLNNGIDISSYITHLDKVVNNYTPLANGYIHIRVKKTSLPIVSIRMQQLYGLMTSCETSDFATWGTYLPVVAGNSVEIYISADSLGSAKFYPCLGNV